MTIGLNFLSKVIDAGAGTALLKLEADLFLEGPEAGAFDFMRRYYRQYRSVPDSRTVQEQTGVRLPGPRGDLNFHMDNLYDRRVYEEIRLIHGELREAVKGARPGPAIDVLESGVRRIRRSRRGNSMVDLGQGIGQVRERLERVRGHGGMSGIPTPWETLSATTAGYQPADLITFVGRMGTGKTMQMLWQAEKVFNEGFSALVVTTEMGSEAMVRRWMSMHYNLDPYVLKSGMVSSYLMRKIEEWETTLLGRERFRILPLGLGAQVQHIEAAVDEVQPDIVFVDGSYLLKPSHSRPNNRNEATAYVFDELKQLTISTNLPWVVNTQFNRQAGARGKDGSLETIAMSDVVGMHSSIVVAVKPGITDNPMDSREMDVLKGREGESALFPIHYTFKPTNLNEMTAEERAAVEGAAAAASEGDDGDSGFQWR